MTKSCTLFLWGIFATVTYTGLSAAEDAFEFFDEDNKKSVHTFVMELLSKATFGIILVILLYFMHRIRKDLSKFDKKV